MSAALKLPVVDSLYERLQQLPEHVVGEIIAGELVVSPRPAIRHTKIGSGVSQELGFRFDRKTGGGDFPGGWWILVEPELHLGEDIVVPDIAGWKREHLPVLPQRAHFLEAPDWVCEVLSPDNALRDKREKAQIYRKAGVRWYWMVDPQQRTVEALRREGEFWVLLGVWGDEDRARIEPFDAVELELSRWWEGLERG